MTRQLWASALPFILCLATCSADPTPTGQSPVEACASLDCSDHGYCFVHNGVGVCVCDEPYRSTGRTCVNPDDPCASVTCSGHGTCVSDGSTVQCQCDSGYYASFNECLPVGVHGGNVPPPDGGLVGSPDGCQGVVCGNGGQCTITNDGPICVWCSAGQVPHGSICVPEDDPCVDVSCGANASCVKQGSQAQCQCNPGYERDGDQCVASTGGDPCASRNCGAHAHCEVREGQGRCFCDPGYERQGGQCVRADPCSGKNCGANAHCEVRNGQGRCLCNPGYERSGDRCVREREGCRCCHEGCTTKPPPPIHFPGPPC